MLPRIQAEEYLEQASLRHATNGRTMDEGARNRYFKELNTRMVGHEIKPIRPTSYDQLAAMGIVVVQEPVRRVKKDEEK